MTSKEDLEKKLYLLEDKYRNMLSNRIKIKKNEHGYNLNDILIFPIWYFDENNTTRISFLNKAIERKVLIQELDESIDFEKSYRENHRNKSTFAD